MKLTKKAGASPIGRRLVSVGRIISKLLLAFVLTALAWIGFVQWRMATLPDAKLPPQDVGIVLGAALWQTSPSPALSERLDRAVELYRQGTIQRMIVSGGYDRADSKLTEAEGMRNYLIAKGIPESAIFLENHATSTYENMKFSQAIMQKQQWKSAVIITHRYHAVRALDMANFLGYENVMASPMDSNVLMMLWHKSRETLALTKWQLDKLQLSFGIEPSRD
ncbi:YdcF family protein [Paenibacillus cremeus]|uniref:YdcF family protein n=1 Tax=Paenibacillus cremeus TaxID=2163881 RepID=A0A559JDD7_9BACL|nr:YdcF family protein [Paenibacillus cremeus]TVX97885.1 YdcF family protein [Paenibacillus cremeus]